MKVNKNISYGGPQILDFRPPTKSRATSGLPSFQLRITFLLLAIAGLYLIPKINTQLTPSPDSKSLAVTFNYPGAGAELVEREVTSLLEGALSRMNHLVTIESTSSDGQGQIEMEFDRHALMDDVRLLVSTIVRQVHSDLPAGLSYPMVRYKSSFESYPVLLVYAVLNRNVGEDIKKWIDREITIPLSGIKGIHSIEVTGIDTEEAHVRIDQNELIIHGLTIDDIRRALRQKNLQLQLGTVQMKDGNLAGVTFRSTNPGSPALTRLNKISVTNYQGRSIFLGDISDIFQIKQKRKRHYRINGKNSINLIIRSDPAVNQIDLVSKIDEKIEMITPVTEKVEILKSTDRSEYLKEQLRIISIRIAAALAILFLFMLLIYRNFSRLWPVWYGFIITILLSVIVYYFTDLELHLYSLAGFTLSLGIVLDNIIISAEHIRRHGNHNIFVALLAATLTTIGALSIIFFISPEYREQLTHFAWIFIINLGMSLVVSLFLMPVIVKPAPIHLWRGKRMRSLITFNRLFKKHITWTSKHKWIPLTALIFAFGLPLFLLPNKWESQRKIAELYNHAMDGYYGQTIHPPLSKYLGGTLRLFVRSKDRLYFQRRYPEETKLYLNAKMPFGGSTDQLDDIIKKFEHFLSFFPEVRQYHSRINSPFDSRIEISFNEEYQNGIFPYQLKSRLESMAVDMGSGDFQVFGVGRGFDNELRGARLSTHLRMLGYNYDQLWKVAEIARKNLLQHVRIQKVFINPTRNYYAPATQFFQADYDSDFLPPNLTNTSLSNLWKNINPDQGIATTITESGIDMPVRLVYQDQSRNDLWNLRHAIHVHDTSQFFKNSSFMNLEKRTGSYDIVRHNQQYQLYVEYDFIGNYRLAEKVKEQVLKEIAAQLPPGYLISDEKYQWWWRESSDKLTYIVLGSLVLILLISTILFNSIRQALIPLLLVPVAFIGIFLATHFFEFRFDQGGFAALLLVAGLSVNAGIFIINDYNNLKKKWSNRPAIELYIKAYNAKIVPIFLTTLSTILGLMPFLLFEKNEPFWYALAICTIAGLIFSFVGIVGMGAWSTKGGG